MAKINVTAKIGGTYHPKYGLLEKGKEYEIDEKDYGDEIFVKKPNKSGADVKSAPKKKEE